MDMTTPQTATIGGVVLVPVIISLVALARTIPGFPTWLAPLLACGLGLAASVAYEAVSDTHTPQEWLVAVLVGLSLGLAAGGTYSGTKEVVQTVQQRRTPRD